MKFLIALCLLGAALAQYGPAQAPPAYPPQPSYPSQPSYPGRPWYPHHHHLSSSSSESRSHSRSSSSSEECVDCKKLKNYSNKDLTKADVHYLRDKRGCYRAVVSCPFNHNNYTLYGINSDKNSQALSNGFYIQREIKCNRKGKWQADAIEKDDYTFKYVGCQDKGIEAEAKPLSIPTVEVGN